MAIELVKGIRLECDRFRSQKLKEQQKQGYYFFSVWGTPGVQVANVL